MKGINYLIIFLFVSAVGCKKAEKPIKNRVDEFNYIFGTIQNYYPFTEYKNIDLEKLYLEFKPLIESSTESEIENIYISFLTKLKDGHANVYEENGYPIYGYIIPRREKDYESFDIEIVKHYLAKDFKYFGELFTYEILPDNIGYMHYSSFSGNKSEYENFDLILDYFKGTKGFILDIRNNEGGNNISSYYIIKRLISEPIQGTFWTKKGGDFYPQETYYPEGDFQYTKPIVVLINGASFSSAEGFANLCKKISHITLIGDTTGGGSGVPERYELKYANVQLRFPTRCEMRHDGEHYEWAGIVPDILISQTREDIQSGRDKQLEKAIEFLNK